MAKKTNALVEQELGRVREALGVRPEETDIRAIRGDIERVATQPSRMPNEFAETRREVVELGFEDRIVAAPVPDGQAKACPTYTIRADNEFGMRAIIALVRWADSDHRISREDRKALHLEMRTMELWRETNLCR